MTDKTDPIAHAARLLREAAEELQQGHTLSGDRNNWIGEPEAKAAYDEHMGAAAALEAIAASAGSEPVAYAMFADNGNIRLWSKARIPHPDAKPLYLHPSPPEGMVAEQALRKVLSVVQRYLPPDGPTAHDAMTEITEIVDPWPLGPLEKP